MSTRPEHGVHPAPGKPHPVGRPPEQAKRSFGRHQQAPTRRLKAWATGGHKPIQHRLLIQLGGSRLKLPGQQPGARLATGWRHGNLNARIDPNLLQRLDPGLGFGNPYAPSGRAALRWHRRREFAPLRLPRMLIGGRPCFQRRGGYCCRVRRRRGYARVSLTARFQIHRFWHRGRRHRRGGG